MFRLCLNLNNHIQFSISKDKKTVSRIQFSARYKTELEKYSLLSIRGGQTAEFGLCGGGAEETFF